MAKANKNPFPKKFVRLKLDPVLHTQIKVQAALSHVTLTNWIEQVLTARIDAMRPV